MAGFWGHAFVQSWRGNSLWTESCKLLLESDLAACHEPLFASPMGLSQGLRALLASKASLTFFAPPLHDKLF